MSGLNNIDEFNAQVKRTSDRLNGNPASSPSTQPTGTNAEERAAPSSEPSTTTIASVKGKVTRVRKGGSPLVPQKDQATTTGASPRLGNKGPIPKTQDLPGRESGIPHASSNAASPAKESGALTPAKGTNGSTPSTTTAASTVGATGPNQQVPGNLQRPATSIAPEGISRNAINSSPCKPAVMSTRR